MTPRDALEVDAETVEMAWRAGATRYEELTGNQIGEPDSDDLDAMRVALIAVLSELVELAGEPVAVIRSAKEPYGTRFLPEEWDRLENLPNGTRLIAIPPTAPGASHD